MEMLKQESGYIPSVTCTYINTIQDTHHLKLRKQKEIFKNTKQVISERKQEDKKGTVNSSQTFT